MRTSSHYPDATSMWPPIATTGLRVAFGLIWAVAAALTWSPDFAAHYVGYLHNAANGQPAWNAWWFSLWIGLVTPHAGLFTILTRLTETFIALSLLLGFGGRTLYALGGLFSLLVWSTAEGFGGPYAVGVTNIGTAITYVLIFVALIGLHYRAGSVPYSVDYLIERRWPKWQRIAEWSRTTTPPPAPATLSAGIQLWGISAIGLLLVLLIAGLPSTLHVKSATPETAAAAVSPLSLSSGKVEKARDAHLPPLAGEGNEVTVHVIAEDNRVTIANGVEYNAWTFGGTVPAPTIHVRQGQTVHMKFTNNGTMHHSVDFHSAITPPSLHHVDIMPGQTLEFSFVADTPGAFLYHCGTAPVLLHLANGMFGAMIVEPAEPLPKADVSYVIVQNEWYTRQIKGNLMGPDPKKMKEMRADEVVFNGVAFQYRDQPLRMKAGKRARIYFVNAGPSLWSSFHIIGGMFERVYPDGDPAHFLSDVSVYSVGPGAGAIFDIVLPKPGKYHFVDHSFAHLEMGAVGTLDVQPADGQVGSKLETQPKISQTKNTKPVTVESRESYIFDPDKGVALYTTYCAACHQANGAGLSGMYPPLEGNAVVTDEDPAMHISTVLHGAQGRTIDGKTYPAVMPPFGSILSDAEIADIINHERSSWDNHSPKVSAEDIKAVREHISK